MLFSLRQLQEKCREHRRPLYIASADLTKAFDQVSRKGLVTLLDKFGCPPQSLSAITSFHEDMHGTVHYVGSLSKSFPIHSGVKQGCVLAPTCLEHYFPCCFPMPSAYLQKVSAYIRELMTNCSTRPVCVRKLKVLITEMLSLMTQR